MKCRIGIASVDGLYHRGTLAIGDMNTERSIVGIMNAGAPSMVCC